MCACVFLTKADLEERIAAFGTVKEQHLDEYRRCQCWAGHGSEEMKRYVRDWKMSKNVIFCRLQTVWSGHA